MSKSTHHNHGHEAEPNAGRDMPGRHTKAAEDLASHDQDAGHSPNMFRDKFWLSLTEQPCRKRSAVDSR